MSSIKHLLDDIYFKKAYVELYLKSGEEVFEFEFRENDFIFHQIGIKKPITSIGNIEVSDGFYDLETVYGYGGIICNTDNENFIEKAVSKYQEQIKVEKIIAEFARIHPFNDNLFFFKKYYDFLSLDRQTVIIDTSLETQKRRSLYSSTTRNAIKNCEKNLTFEQSEDIESFNELYQKTMARNEADGFYYFDIEYFKKLLALENVFLFFVKNENKDIVSASFFMFSETFGHYHLSANNDGFRNLNGNYFILDSIFEFAKNKNIKYFHLGGGRSNQSDDSLLRFKQKFSKATKDFYIAGKIHDKSIYAEYNKIWASQTDENVKYFLKYRLKTNK